MSRQRSVALIVETFNAHARELLRGIRAFAGGRAHWVLHFRGRGDDLEDLSWLEGWRGDGLLTRLTSGPLAAFVRERGLPTVDLTTPTFGLTLPYVEADDYAVAQRAAEHLLERGFRRFGFVGDRAFPWSPLREAAFREVLAARGLPCCALDLNGAGEAALERWLAALPKPVGVMTSSDVLGRTLLELLRLGDFAVPSEVAVVGVDNDPLLCELADPPLSSVALDGFGTGFLAASLLERLLNGEVLGRRAHLVAPLGVVTRASTDVVLTDDEAVLTLLRLIRLHACDDLKVTDLLGHAPLSRRALEARFRKIVGRTPHAELTRLKLRRIQELLLETALPLEAIAEATGFKHPEYLSVFFKRATGTTPSAYRRAYPKLPA